MSDEQEQESQALIPIIQQTIMFRGLPLVVVRLPDGRPGVVLRWICENLHLAPGPQVLRIKRTEVIADDLVYVQVQTEGGFQTMPTLVLDSVPYWLATIDTRGMEKDDPYPPLGNIPSLLHAFERDAGCSSIHSRHCFL